MQGGQGGGGVVGGASPGGRHWMVAGVGDLWEGDVAGVHREEEVVDRKVQGPVQGRVHGGEEGVTLAIT